MSSSRGPKINVEVYAMLSTTENKKDAFLMELQNNIGKGIAAVGRTLTTLLETAKEKADDEVDPNMSGLVDACKMFCAVHHSITNHRKFLLYLSFNNKI